MISPYHPATKLMLATLFWLVGWEAQLAGFDDFAFSIKLAGLGILIGLLDLERRR